MLEANLKQAEETLESISDEIEFAKKQEQALKEVAVAAGALAREEERVIEYMKEADRAWSQLEQERQGREIATREEAGMVAEEQQECAVLRAQIQALLSASSNMHTLPATVTSAKVAERGRGGSAAW